LQVGSGGRLRIANNTVDQTVIGGDDVASTISSRIELKGSTRNPGASEGGNIWYHAIYTQAISKFFISVGLK